MKRKSKGFTLVELVITIAIVIVLSVVSVPIYEGYVYKAQLSEAYALLGTILSAQKAYFSEYGNFLLVKDSSSYAEGTCWTTYEPIFGIDARGNKYFTNFQIGINDEADYHEFYFHAGAKKPSDSGFRDNKKNIVYLQYNITKGPKLIEGDGSWSDMDSSWFN